MAIAQPNASDKLNSPSHSLQHRQIASDTSAPAQSLIADANGTIIGALSGPKSVTNATTNQTPATSDTGKLYNFTSSTAADRDITLPSVGSTEELITFWVANESDYVITVKPSDTDRIWSSGAGYGVEMLPQTLCQFVYDHTNTTWKIVRKTGGQVRLEGLRFWLPCDRMHKYASNSGSNATLLDETRRHMGYTYNTFYMNVANNSYEQYYSLGGTSGYAAFNTDQDWNVFGSSSGHVTIAADVYIDANTGSNQYIFSQYEDGSNNWAFYYVTGSPGKIGGFNTSGGSSDPNLQGGTINTGTWYKVAMILDNGKTGLYIDGSQVSYDASFTVDTYTGALNVGRYGAGSAYLDGNLRNLIIAYNNIFDATPNATPDDTLTNYDRPFVGVM